MAKILITGGYGFIGTLLSVSLKQDKHTITIYDKTHNPRLPSEIKWIRGDITNLEQVNNACKGQDGIIHLAAISRKGMGNEDPHACIKVNILGTTNILEAIRKTNKSAWVIVASTRDSVGEYLNNTSWKNILDKKNNIYGFSKFIAEIICKQYANNFGLRVMALRFGDVYGSIWDHDDKVLPLFVSNALNDVELKVMKSEEKFSFVYWTDLIEGIKKGISFMETREEGFYDDFALYSDTYTSLSELARIITEEVNNKYETYSNKMTSSLPEELDMSRKKTKNVLGFSSKINLREGIRNYINDIKIVRGI